jgi:predicted component of type VI protein secretion system
MPKLLLKFEERVLSEVPVGAQPVTIGRSPDNLIPIDNLAVSNYHARIFVEGGRLMLEDLNSLNGTFINQQRIVRAALKDGDAITIGKHVLVVQNTAEAAEIFVPAAAPKTHAPKVSETVVLDTKQRRELAQQAAAAGERSQVAPTRMRVPTLVVMAGKTEAPEYLLSSKLTVIGKSSMATVRLRGWFAPQVAAQITQRNDGFYIGRADRVPKINGLPITGPTKLNEGDLIEIGKVKLNFIYRE